LYELQFQASIPGSLGTGESITLDLMQTTLPDSLSSTLVRMLEFFQQPPIALIDVISQTSTGDSLTPSHQAEVIQSMAHSLLWGTLRTVNEENNRLSLSGIAMHPSSSGLQFTSGHPTSHYVDVEQGNCRRQAHLLHSLGHSAPDGFRLFPVPRGSLGGLRPLGLESPPLGSLLVRVMAVGLNFRDVLNVLGMYPGDPGPPGGDCSCVRSHGGGFHGVGESVFGLSSGCLGTHSVGWRDSLAPMPLGLTFEEAATMPTVFVTVDLSLGRSCGLLARERVLVHAASGGVGLAALQAIPGCGGLSYSTGGSPTKRALLRGLGSSLVCSSRDTRYVEDVVGFGGVGMVLNSLTSSGLVGASLSCLVPCGRFVEIGKRDVWSVAACSLERTDVSYGLVAVDFLPPRVVGDALCSLSRACCLGALRSLTHIVHGLGSTSAALRQMSQARHVGKVVVRSPCSFGLFPRGRTVLTGGTGALGSLVCGWLVEQGQVRVQLLGRTGRASSSSPSGRVSVWSGLVETVRADASLLSECSSCLHGGLSSSCGPVWGVMHAGGVLLDRTVWNQTVSTVRGVFGPKVSAMHCLDSLFVSYPVQSWVLFSSVASLLGSPGQSNYSAANSVLDAWSHAQRRRGGVAVSVQWGAWSGGGMASQDASTASRAERTGMGLLSSAEGLGALRGVVLEAGMRPCSSLGWSGQFAAVPFVWDAAFFLGDSQFGA
jgi:NADPH:quinone reductase-like Zn-dependent oxidoreductase